MKDNKTLTILLGIIIIGLLVYIAMISSADKTLPTQEVKTLPMVDAMATEWAENLYNSEEMFFDYWVFNYGDEEVKNIIVECRLYDNKDRVVKSVVDNVGNLASNSLAFKEVVTSTIQASDEELFSSICYIKSCDNCDILYKRIPDLRETIEG